MTESESETPSPIEEPERVAEGEDVAKVHKPHDALFKLLFDDPEVAAGEFRALLPPAILEGIDLATIKREPDSFVGAGMAESHSDRLFSVQARGREALIYVLVEHRSTPDPMLSYRVLGYMVEVWKSWLRRNEGARHLPMVIPLVVFQGPKPWTGPRRLAELIDLPEGELDAVRGQLPDFAFLLDDLAQRSDQELDARSMPPHGVFGLVLLKHARDPKVDLLALWRDHGDTLRELRQRPNWAETLEQLARYTVSVGEIDFGELTEVVAAELGKEAREVVVTTAEKLKAEGKAQMLTSMLQASFGDLSTETRERVEGASVDQLDRWAVRVLSASTLEEVFAAPS